MSLLLLSHALAFERVPQNKCSVWETHDPVTAPIGSDCLCVRRQNEPLKFRFVSGWATTSTKGPLRHWTNQRRDSVRRGIRAWDGGGNELPGIKAQYNPTEVAGSQIPSQWVSGNGFSDIQWLTTEVGEPAAARLVAKFQYRVFNQNICSIEEADIQFRDLPESYPQRVWLAWPSRAWSDDRDCAIGREFFLTQTAMHEWGHAVGLGENSEFRSVMNPHICANYGGTQSNVTIMEDDYLGLAALTGTTNDDSSNYQLHKHRPTGGSPSYPVPNSVDSEDFYTRGWNLEQDHFACSLDSQLENDGIPSPKFTRTLRLAHLGNAVGQATVFLWATGVTTSGSPWSFQFDCVPSDPSETGEEFFPLTTSSTNSYEWVRFNNCRIPLTTPPGSYPQIWASVEGSGDLSLADNLVDYPGTLTIRDETHPACP